MSTLKIRMIRGRWIRLDKQWPPKEAKVLLTNNLKAKDAHGQMSHIWIGHPQISSGPTELFPNTPEKGTFISYTDGWSLVHNLTHWMPLPDASEDNR